MAPQSDVSIIGESPLFVAMLEHVSRAAPLDQPVLVMGERGTGKELVASRLHYLSGRWEQPLVKVNCAALTETLLETELFGHEAGAFTGATSRRIGRFERADGGTLFLDELGTVSMRMQEKILRVIEYGEFERVGATRTTEVDVRIVGATNEDLPSMAREGRYRADLLDRLAFDVVHVPPLRVRPEDVLALAHHFAVNMTSELGRPFFPGFGKPATAALLEHDWPGNVRELKNAVERSVYRWESIDTPVNVIEFDPFRAPWTDEPVDPAPPPDAGPPEFPLDLQAFLHSTEESMVRRALEASGYHQGDAAVALGLSYDQLRGRLKRLGIRTRAARGSGAATAD